VRLTNLRIWGRAAQEYSKTFYDDPYESHRNFRWNMSDPSATLYVFDRRKLWHMI
jgi:hypothetical protein